MKIGVISDTHADVETTRHALEMLREEGVSKIIHCGDVTTSDVLELFDGWDVSIVYGNMDYNKGGLRGAARQLEGVSIRSTYTEELNGIKLAACHGHQSQVLQDFINSGMYDYVFHGHTHKRRDERIGETRVINPGALGGMRKQSRSLCVIDLETGNVRFIEL